MALIDKASLLMVPSTYEAGKLYNVLPSGNRAPDSKGGAGYDQTRADFDFDRGSNAAATRIGSDGLLKKYRENLLTESNNFSDSDWNKNAGGSFTSGQEGYNGTNDAWQFNVTTASNSGAWQNITFSGVATFSAYFKKGTLDKIGFTNYAGSGYECWFDLTNGTIGQQTGDLIDAKIEAIGTNGWYRCSITDVGSGANYFQLKPSNAYSGTSTAGHIFIQSAQVESSLVATDYLNSTTTTGKAGLLIDLPRINYDANGENGALLLEPSRANLVQFSEYFGDSSWTKTATTTEVGFLSPDGNLNASKLLENNTNSIHRIYQTATVSASPNATISAYVKYNGRRFVLMRIADSSVGRWYDLIDGVKGDAFTSAPNDSTIEPVGNDWYRITISHSVASVARFELWISDTESNSAYQGDTTKGVYLYGAQLESNASYVSSYIPNHGTSGGVTRAADDCRKTNIGSLLNNTEGTLFAEYIRTLPVTAVIFQLSIGNNTNRVQIENQGGNNGKPLLVVSSGGSTQAVVVNPVGIPLNEVCKVAVTYKQNEFKLYVNGVLTGTDTSGAVPTSLTAAYIGSEAGTSYVGFKVTQAIYFPTALTNAELATLTTL